LEVIWRKEVVAYKGISRHLIRKAEEDHKKLSRRMRLIWEPVEYKSSWANTLVERWWKPTVFSLDGPP